jgi:hypothetical protein
MSPVTTVCIHLGLCVVFIHSFIHSFIRSFFHLSAALQSLKGLWSPHTERYCRPFRQFVGLLWTSDQPVTKASTYTGQHNTETRKQPCFKWDLNPRSQSPTTDASDRETTGTVSSRFVKQKSNLLFGYRWFCSRKLRTSLNSETLLISCM